MLSIVNLEELERLLLALPALVRRQEQRSPSFVAHGTDWLKLLEEALVATRQYQAGAIAAMRSRVLSAEQGEIPSDVTFRGKPTRGRVTAAVLSDVLRRAAELVSSIVADHRGRFGEAERVAVQLVTVANSRSVLPPRGTSSTSEHLAAVRTALDQAGDLQAGAVHLESLVGARDALVFLDRALVGLPLVTSRSSELSANQKGTRA